MDLPEIEREMNARLGPVIQRWYDQEILRMGRRLAAWEKMATQWEKGEKGQPMTIKITRRLSVEQPPSTGTGRA